MNYKERLIIELEELIIRIERLRKYIKENEHSDLEEKQLNAMSEYKLYLQYRIVNLMK